MLERLERYEAALASYDRAIELHTKDRLYSGHTQTWAHRGLVLYNLQRYGDAIASFNQIIEINQSDNLVPAPSYLFPLLYENTLVWFQADFAWFHKACSYAMQGEIEQAIESLQRAIELRC